MDTKPCPKCNNPATRIGRDAFLCAPHGCGFLFGKDVVGNEYVFYRDAEEEEEEEE